MTVKFTATHPINGEVVTRRSDADYTHAAIRSLAGGGVRASFHLTEAAAVKAASRFGGHVVRALVNGTPAPSAAAKEPVSLDGVVAAVSQFGFVAGPEQGNAGGRLVSFVNGDVIVDVQLGHADEVKGRVLVIKGGRIQFGVLDLKSLRDILAGQFAGV